MGAKFVIENEADMCAMMCDNVVPQKNQRLKRVNAGHYTLEKEEGTIHIVKISYNLWVWSVDNGMTKGTFNSLREAREYFGSEVI